MDENNRKDPLKERTVQKKKSSKKALPLSVKIYRAVYTAVYVAAQLIRECALYLYERLAPLLKKGGSWLLEKAKALFEGIFLRLAERKERKEAEKPKPKVLFGQVQKTESERFGSMKKKPAYIEDDFLDFEDEDRRKRKKRLKKKKKSKKKGAQQDAQSIKSARPNFEEYLWRKEEKKQRRAQGRRRLLFGALISVLVLQILCGLFSVGLYVYTGNNFRFSGTDLYFREGKSYEVHGMSAKQAYGADGTPMFNMTALAGWLELETVSDRNYVYYTLKDGSRIVLMKDSRTAVLNGESINLSQAVVFSGKQVYAPVELIGDYTSGLFVSYSEKEKRVTLQRCPDPVLSTQRNPIYLELTLTVCGIERAPLPVLIVNEEQN